ncbi:MAG: hypothetical protein QOJ65_477, partial [Fimbriimonadaceae bacterium]|nr:hypothetical protein [Fimbriimonadaceae bacterium]
MNEQPRFAFIQVMGKLATQASEEEIRAACGDLDADERKLVEGLLLTRAGEEEAAKNLFAQCLDSESPGVAMIATSCLKDTSEPREPKEPEIYRADADILHHVIGWMKWSIK